MELLFVERTVVIRNKGSAEFSPEEQAADIVLIDVKCTALAGTEYFNTRSLPPYGYYGCVTLFGGATVAKRVPLEFVYQRVLDFESIYRRIKCYLTKIEEIAGEIFNYVAAPNNTPPAGSGEPRDSFEYRGLPYSKIKLANDRATQWNVTIRSYTEVDERCESESKSDDPTKGEPEYPSPLPIPDPNNFPSGLPDPTAAYPGADPNDFPENPGGAPWVVKPAYFGMSVKASSASGAPNCVQDITYPENFTWENAGPPPYTVKVNYGVSSPCAGRGQGYKIVASDNTESPGQSELATVFSADIVVFQYTPF